MVYLMLVLKKGVYKMKIKLYNKIAKTLKKGNFYEERTV